MSLSGPTVFGIIVGVIAGIFIADMYRTWKRGRR